MGFSKGRDFVRRDFMRRDFEWRDFENKGILSDGIFGSKGFLQWEYEQKRSFGWRDFETEGIFWNGILEKKGFFSRFVGRNFLGRYLCDGILFENEGILCDGILSGRKLRGKGFCATGFWGQRDFKRRNF